MRYHISFFFLVLWMSLELFCVSAYTYAEQISPVDSIRRFFITGRVSVFRGDSMILVYYAPKYAGVSLFLLTLTLPANTE